MKVVQPSSVASTHLDLIRGLAAVAVMIGHVRGLFFVDWERLPESAHTLAVGFTYFATSLGHEAVMVFFVLSGFLIGGAVLKSLHAWAWRDYAAARAARLYTVLVPTLVLTAILDSIGERQAAGHAFYLTRLPHFADAPVASAHAAVIFVGNLAFLQTIAVPTFGSNLPLWSLANEFWYYVLFPPLALLVYGGLTLSKKICCAAIVVGGLVFLPLNISVGFGIWLLGAAIHMMPAMGVRIRRSHLRWLTWSSGGGVFAAVVLAKWLKNGLYSDWVVGAAVALWLYTLVQHANGPPKPHTSRRSAVATILAGCSYSLYAVHFPVLLFLRTVIAGDSWLPGLRPLIAAGGVALGIWMCAFIFARATEAHTRNVRDLLTGLFRRRRTATTLATS